MMNVVSSTIMTAMPSRPIVNRMPHDGIHGEIDDGLPRGVRRIETPPQADRDDELHGESDQRDPARRRTSAAREFIGSGRQVDHRAADPDRRRTEQRDEEKRREHPVLVADGRQRSSGMKSSRNVAEALG